MYALVDCNSFYASCEQIFRPDLIGKPVVVLSNNDGCIVAANREAKSLTDLPLWQPVFKYEELLKKLKVNIFSSNYPLYGDISNRVMNTLQNFSPNLEIYSIDEAFLLLENFDRYNLTDYGILIKNTIFKNIGMPVGVGIAPTKALAKVANHISKKFRDKLNNVYVIDTEEKRIKALKWLPIGDVWGIGRAHKKRLNIKGILNAYDFTLLSDSLVRKEMGVVGLRLKKELEGQSCLALEEIQPKKKAIGSAKSFGKKLKDFNLISEALANYVSNCAAKLRKQKSCCNQLHVFLQTNYFDKSKPQYHNNIVITLPQSSNSSIELIKYANKALKKIFKPGYEYKKVGILLMSIVPNNQIQGKLFYDVNLNQHKTIMKSLDSINNKFGKNVLRLASQGYNKRKWNIKQERLSPKYTTNWYEILEINL